MKVVWYSIEAGLLLLASRLLEHVSGILDRDNDTMSRYMDVLEQTSPSGASMATRWCSRKDAKSIHMPVTTSRQAVMATAQHVPMTWSDIPDQVAGGGEVIKETPPWGRGSCEC